MNLSGEQTAEVCTLSQNRVFRFKILISDPFPIAFSPSFTSTY